MGRRERAGLDPVAVWFG